MVSGSRRWLFSVAAALAVGACLAPTLPLPPPAEPTVSGPDDSGTVALTGYVQPGSWVFAVNRATNAGAFHDTDEKGHYELSLQANVGDSVAFWYEIEGNTSDTLVFTIRRR
jgi:hypothetical protein